MPVLVDTSVWINYFRGETGAKKLDLLIDENLIVINDLILAELAPFLEIRKQRKPIHLLHLISNLPSLSMVNGFCYKNQTISFLAPILQVDTAYPTHNPQLHNSPTLSRSRVRGNYPESLNLGHNSE
jgi:predicted nucleic acid-binding protein